MHVLTCLLRTGRTSLGLGAVYEVNCIRPWFATDIGEGQSLAKRPVPPQRRQVYWYRVASGRDEAGASNIGLAAYGFGSWVLNSAIFSVFRLPFSWYSPSLWYAHLWAFVVLCVAVRQPPLTTSVFGFLTYELSSFFSFNFFNNISFQSSVTDAIVVISLIFFGFFRTVLDFPALAFRCPWSTPRAVRLFVVLSPSPSDVFPKPSTRSPDLPEHPGNNPSISSLCFGTLYPEKLMQLVFVCPNANCVKFRSSVFVGFIFGACRRESFFRSASSISLSIWKVIQSLPSHSSTRRWPHPYPASYAGRPVQWWWWWWWWWRWRTDYGCRLRVVFVFVVRQSTLRRRSRR